LQGAVCGAMDFLYCAGQVKSYNSTTDMEKTSPDIRTEAQFQRRLISDPSMFLAAPAVRLMPSILIIEPV